MNFEELLIYLDLDEASQFEYFDAIAELLESEEYIDSDAMYQLFEGADKGVVTELIDEYFEDILEGLPDNAGEMYSLLHQIKMCLMGMVSNMGEDREGYESTTGDEAADLRKFTDEFYRFQTWYSHESEVELQPDDGGRPIYHNVRDAITASRLEKLGGEKYRYNFENALTYELDGYVMSFADLVAAAEEGDESRNGVASEDESNDELNSHEAGVNGVDFDGNSEK